MPSHRTEFSRRAVRWLWPVTLLALAPKCMLCVFAYVGLGTALGLGGPELCGAPINSTLSWASVLAGLGVATGFAALSVLALRRRTRSGETVPDKRSSA